MWNPGDHVIKINSAGWMGSIHILRTGDLNADGTANEFPPVTLCGRVTDDDWAQTDSCYHSNPVCLKCLERM